MKKEQLKINIHGSFLVMMAEVLMIIDHPMTCFFALDEVWHKHCSEIVRVCLVVE